MIIALCSLVLTSVLAFGKLRLRALVLFLSLFLVSAKRVLTCMFSHTTNADP